ncbi:MAG TPA: hypothetical protein VNM47_04725 [Terriglobia bacterium]|nr:hypothetical protein [Terriglobia bacterium]
MKKMRMVGSWVALLALIGGVGRVQAAGKPSVVKGYVIDSACTFVKNLEKPISPDCADACAKAGSPLVILSDNGIVYWPISAEVPASGQNTRLLPFAGKRVVVTGTVYEKGGSQAIVIANIRNDSKP